ncbi:FadR family transcriptional regulator [Brevibacillus sp. LEMMJ03]|nr:FadR family transcriptional regulator [Brevibacillus sp. LEMMJ03]
MNLHQTIIIQEKSVEWNYHCHGGTRMFLHKKNYEIIAEELQRIIESGLLKPGDKLDTIENLAKQYHVSRSTIREALSHLKALGLIESRQGGGTFVKSPPFQSAETMLHLNNPQVELLQIMQVRKILEIGCVELAAANRTDENIEELERILKQMKEALGNEEISHLYDVNFHLAIARSTQNPILQSLMENFASSLFRTMQDIRKLWLHTESAMKLYEEHKLLVEAIKNRDAKRGMELMAKHLQRSELPLTKENK